MHFTFDRNDSYAAAGRGEYDDIRIFHLDHSPQPYRAHTERVYTTAPHSFATTRPITAEYRAGGGSRTYSHAREAYRGPADEPLMYTR